MTAVLDDYDFIRLKLDAQDPDLSGLDELLSDSALDHLEYVVRQVEQPYPWAAAHVLHAIGHLRTREYRHAWPPLMTGIEGLYWAAAERDGYLDERGRFTANAARSKPPRNAIDIILALPINERVQNLLRRKAFGGPASAFRHGRMHEVGEREQCLMWLLALVVWIDGWGWNWAIEVARSRQ